MNDSITDVPNRDTNDINDNVNSNLDSDTLPHQEKKDTIDKTSTSSTDKSSPNQNNTSSSKTNNKNADHNHKRTKKNQTSFTADSPYFTAYVDKEMKSLNVLTTTLRDISNKAKTFGKCGVLMSEATRRLSSACKLQPNYKVDGGSGNGEDGNDGGNSGVFDERQLDNKNKSIFESKKKSVGSEMVGVLLVLGRVLDEIADAQISMCESLEASLSLSLETFIGTELEEANRLKEEAEQMTESANSGFAKYLHGKHAQHSSSATSGSSSVVSGVSSNDSEVSSWNKISEGVGNQLGRMGISSSVKNDVSLSPMKGGRKAKNNSILDKDPTEKAISAAYLRQNLEEIRFSQANAELKRFQLLKHVDALKTRRNFGLGESILASLNGIKAYFHHCSDLIQGLAPKLQGIQHEQAKARQVYEAQLKPLESREKGLHQAINEVKIAAANAGVIADAISRGQTTGLGASMIADQPTSTEAIEEETKIWDITRFLTRHSLYIRDPKPSIEVEGWLYKKASTRMAMNTWSKRWFVLDKNGIFYLKGGSLSENGKFGSSNGSLERVKVCDTVLCTVREVNAGFRFCFEIISPNSRPYMLQACGPVEFNKWVFGVRKCLERQLVQGNVPSDDMLLKRDTPKAGRSTKDPFPTSNDDGDNPIEKSRKVDEISMTDSVSTFNSMQSSVPKNPLIKQILSENLNCADCEQKRPEWVSLNLGALVCIECSGVHRSLGVHLSKVRSLKLDQLSRAEYAVIQALGNQFVNSVWEGGVNNQTGWKKPEPNDSRKVKEEWIKSKYMWRGFVNFNESDGNNQEERETAYSKELFEASSKCDIRAAAAALAKGANVNWANPEQDNKTSLQVCIPSGLLDNKDWKGIRTAELLIQNGAKINILDQNVLDMALRGSSEHDMVNYIMTRIA